MRWATTLVPRPQLTLAVAGGAALVVLTLVSPLVWVAVALYHLALAAVLAADARRLPLPTAFTSHRELAEPLALGRDQEVGLAIACPAAAGLRAELADHAPLEFGAEPAVLAGAFDTQGRLQAGYRILPCRRGVFGFGGLDVRVWRPRGWWWRQFRLELAQRVAVRPDLLAIRQWELTLRRGVRPLTGQRRGRPPGAATVPAGLRDYLPGDDARRIAWRATARRDRPVTMELEAERGQQVVLALDCGRLMTAPAGSMTKLDFAVNAALLLAWVAQHQGDRVGLMAFAGRVSAYLAPGRGPAQLRRLMEVLTEARAEYVEPEYEDALAFLATRVRARSLVVLLTDVLDPEASAELVSHALRLGRRHRVLVVAMADPELMAALRRTPSRSADVYEWAAAEELLAARRRAFQTLRQGGVEGLDVEAGQLSPAVVERYLELKERGLA
jgi:uncharacterized protein (DUF58 family)